MPSSINAPVGRALDLGFGYTKFTKSHLDDTDKVDVGMFPSYCSPSSKRQDQISGGPLQALDVITVEAGGMHWSVGKDSKLAGTGRASQLLEDSFFVSSQYLALARGAISFMSLPDGCDTIDVLTVGLPLSVFEHQELRNRIITTLKARHPIGRPGNLDDSILVRRVNVIPQVLGSLVALALPLERYDEIESERNLTIDVGYGTLLWLTTDGLKALRERSGGTMGGVSSLLDAMLRTQDRSLVGNLAMMERLDKALINKADTFKVAGREVQVADLRPGLEAAVSENLTLLLRSISSVNDIDNVFLTGGGAHLYREAIKGAFPDHELIEDNGSTQFTNVRGFQILSEQQLVE